MPITDCLSLDAWKDTWTGLGAATGDEALHASLLTRYAEPQRHYHTLQHLRECLERLRDASHMAVRLHEVEVALWFHDAVYDVRAADNEQRSAHLAVEAVRAAGLTTEVAERIAALIMATRHDVVPHDTDAQLLVDVDLAILGADDARFDEYERQVREEYAWVPRFIFRRKRRGVLQGFLDRAHIYSTAHFRNELESAARANLTRSITALGG